LLGSSQAKENCVRRLGPNVALRSDLIKDENNGLREALMQQDIDGVDVVMDVVGGEVFEGALRCLRPEGRLVVVGFASGRIPQVAANYLC
jgi:NADPH:quinone reductase